MWSIFPVKSKYSNCILWGILKNSSVFERKFVTYIILRVGFWFAVSVLIIISCSFSVEWWFYAMASSHSSSPVPQGSSSDVFFKIEVDPSKHIRPVPSLPDVCPKEPTGNAFFFFL